MKIELIYDEACPNFEAARNVLKQALDELGLSVAWQEWNRSQHLAPRSVYQFGSPTILINGIDVAGIEPQAAAICCRLYMDEKGHLKKIPPVELVVQAILQANESQ